VSAPRQANEPAELVADAVEPVAGPSFEAEAERDVASTEALERDVVRAGRLSRAAVGRQPGRDTLLRPVPEPADGAGRAVALICAAQEDARARSSAARLGDV